MKFTTLKGANYKFWRGRSRSEMIDSLRYIEQMCGVLGISSEIDVNKHFPGEEEQGSTNCICTDKRLINQKLFELKGSISSMGNIPEQDIDIKIQNSQVLEYEKAIRNYKQNVEQVHEDIKFTEEKLSCLKYDLIYYQEQLDAFQNSLNEAKEKERTVSLKKEIERINNEGFFLFEEHKNINGELVLIFQTAYDCTIRYPINGGNIYNFGRFKVCLFLRQERKDCYSRVFPLKKNLKATATDESFFHPHVYVNGSLCLGNLLERHKIAINSWDIYETLKTIKELLFSYNPNDAYKHVEAFRRCRNYSDYQSNSHLEEIQPELFCGSEYKPKVF